MFGSVMALTAASLLALGCSSAVMQPRVAPADVTAADARTLAPDEADTAQQGAALEVELPEAAETSPVGAFGMRAVGDFVVYRFSGSYRDAPVTVSQRVVARDAKALTLDVTVDDHGALLRLRLRLDERPATRGEVLSAAKLEGDRELPFGVAAYEQLMSEIMLSADDNEKRLGSSRTSVELGKRRFKAERVRYQVRVGAHAAVMETVNSPMFAWGDLGGQITTLDGGVLYKAEIIDVGGRGFGDKPVAVQAPDEEEADYDFE